MVNVIFNKKYLIRLVGHEMSDQELSDIVEKMGLEVEEQDKDSVTIAVLNRPDLMEINGFARAVRHFAYRGTSFNYSLHADKPVLEIKVNRNVNHIRPYIAALVANGLNFDDESLTHLINFTEKLSQTFGRNRKKIAIGMHDLSKVEPKESSYIEYGAFKGLCFIPLGYTSEASFDEILKEHKKGKEYSDILDNAKGSYPALVDDRGAMSLIPIVNSERTKVTTKTHNMLLEITGSSIHAVEGAISLFAAALKDMESEVYPVKISYGKKEKTTPNDTRREMSILLTTIERNIGAMIGFNRIITLANRMGYDAALLGKRILFKLPTYRLDLINEQDIIEDIAIAYGYENIMPIPIFSSQVGELDNGSELESELANVMLGLGFTETVNSYLTNKETNFDKMNIEESEEYVEVKESRVSTIGMLRTSLLPSLLLNLSKSTHQRMPQKLFETDLKFNITNGKVNETYALAAVAVDPKSNFNDAKALVIALGRSLGVEIKVRKADDKRFIPGRCAEIISSNTTIGVFGELHPIVLRNFGIEEPGIALEIEMLNAQLKE